MIRHCQKMSPIFEIQTFKEKTPLAEYHQVLINPV